MGGVLSGSGAVNVPQRVGQASGPAPRRPATTVRAIASSRVLSEHHINILGSTTGAGSDRLSRMRFDIELADPSHLETLLSAIKRVDSVYDAYRALPGR